MRVEQRSICARYYLVLQQAGVVQQQNIVSIFGHTSRSRFKGGFPIHTAIVRDVDRAAPLGTGMFKVGGNYAVYLRAKKMVRHEKGYASEFYLDAKEKYVDECGVNFFGIKNNTYVTPKSTLHLTFNH